MDSSTRAAHRRVGAAAIAGFLALLLLGLARGPASANPAVPAATPAPGSSQQPQQQLPGFGRERRFRGGVPDFGGGDPDGGFAPDPGVPAAPSAPDGGMTTT